MRTSEKKDALLCFFANFATAPPMERFENMKLKDITSNIRLRLNIAELNEMQLAMSQSQARDIILLAPTGSGKTLAFTIAMLRNTDLKGTPPQTLVLAPSRELVLQIAGVVKACAGPDIKVAALYGGHAVSDEVNTLSVTPHIIIATPGRMLDHIKRGNADVSKISTLVLDEYDKSLELGFADEMKRIIAKLTRVNLRILTSATQLGELPEFLSRADSFEVLDYLPVTESPRRRTQIVEVPSPVADKLDTLVDLLRSLHNQKVMVFVNHRESAERVASRLWKENMPAGLYHGGLEQQQRRMAVEMFDNGTTPILATTDLASRGLDIEGIGSVIHYHLPPEEAVWTHRNGRTARQSATGTVYAIVADGESVSEFISFDRTYTPKSVSPDPIAPSHETIYINAGRKEKISKGDIVGYLIAQGRLDGTDIGIITLDDHSAAVAVAVGKAATAIEAAAGSKLKNQRVRLSIVNPRAMTTPKPSAKHSEAPKQGQKRININTYKRK